MRLNAQLRAAIAVRMLLRSCIEHVKLLTLAKTITPTMIEELAIPYHPPIHRAGCTACLYQVAMVPVLASAAIKVD
jgi:hypothetical protein